MAKPNYAYEKRQKEIAKKRKKEEKRLLKAKVATVPAQDLQSTSESTEESETVVER